MSSRLISGLTTVAIVGIFMFVPASVFAGNAAEAMSKLKAQSEIKAKSSTASESASARGNTARTEVKEKAKKAVKEMIEKGKK